MNNMDWTKKDKAYIAGTYNRYDLLITKGKGSRCTGEDGREYIDFTSGIGVNSLGFCEDDWVGAITDQAKKLQHTSNLFYTQPQILLAEELVLRSGIMKKAFFCNSGAEANEAAIKVARKYGNSGSGNEKNRIITLYRSFHGRTMATITATGQDNYHSDFFPFVEGFDHCHGGDLETLAELADDKVCAVMIELIQGEGGVIPLDKEYVEGVVKLCRERDILLIVDEVQTGGGRTGSFFAYQQYGVEADLVTFAKGIGGGLPIGGVLFNKKTADVLTFGDHGTTYGGNPIACAGALAVLKKVTPQLLDSVREKGEYMRGKLRTMEKVEDVVGMGLMIGVKLKEMAPGKVVDQCREKGLLVLTAGDKVRLLPPLNISSHDISRGLEIMEEVLG
jgi:acetylornithine/N-succinyldiaminopimelate aminotransferase